MSNYSGHVGMYLATKACDGKDNALIMSETAKGYYSAIKLFLELKYADVGVIPVFQKNVWDEFFSAANGTKQRMHYKHNVAMSNPKAMIFKKKT